MYYSETRRYWIIITLCVYSHCRRCDATCVLHGGAIFVFFGTCNFFILNLCAWSVRGDFSVLDGEGKPWTFYILWHIQLQPSLLRRIDGRSCRIPHCIKGTGRFSPHGLFSRIRITSWRFPKESSHMIIRITYNIYKPFLPFLPSCILYILYWSSFPGKYGHNNDCATLTVPSIPIL